MRRLLYLPAILLLCALGCDSGNPVAPTGTVLTMVASSTQIGLNGSTVITVTGFRPDGNPLYPGTQVIFSLSGSTSSGGGGGTGGGGGGGGGGVGTNSGLVVEPNSDGLGAIEPTVAEIDDTGKATAVFTSDGRAGSVTITGTTTTSDASASVTVQIGETDATKPTLSITANPTTIGTSETSTISVIARNSDGSVYGAGGLVRLRTSLGTLEDEELVTNSDGETQTTLDAGSEPGEATITGSIGASDEVTAAVTIENRKPSLEVFANPSSIAVGNEATIRILARDHNSQPLGSGYRISLFADLGSIPESATTDAAGEAEATFDAGFEAGTATISAILDNSDTATVSIQIRDAAADVQLTANPSSIPRGDATVNLTAVVRNAQGVAVPSILVTFNSEVGSLTSQGSGVQTSTRGEATDVLTVTQADLPASLSEFTVTATVVSEGNEITGTATVRIQQ